MTTAIEHVSALVQHYVDAVGDGSGPQHDIPPSLSRAVAGLLEGDELMFHVVCLRNPSPYQAPPGLAVLTDRAVLLVGAGGESERISLYDVTRVTSSDVELGGTHYPALGIVHRGRVEQIVANPVSGWTYERARVELQRFAREIEDAASNTKKVPRPRPRPTVEHTVPAAAAPPAHQGAKFVGNAAPVGGVPLSRVFNALCYLIAGIAMVVMSMLPGFPSGGTMALAIVLGLGAMAYAAKIFLTRTSYWVSSWVYILAFGAVAAMFGFLAQ